MAKNIFTVDLGDLPLDDQQRKKINKAIQQAVAVELTSFELSGEIVFVPVDRWDTGTPGLGNIMGSPNGPIINGIIIDRLSSARVKTIMQLKSNEGGK